MAMGQGYTRRARSYPCLPAGPTGPSLTTSLAHRWEHGWMRIVSLVPAATEIVFALGLGDELVGRSPADDFPVEVMDVPLVAWTDPGSQEPGRPPSALIGAD